MPQRDTDDISGQEPSRLEELQRILESFRDERAWLRFHTPKDLAAAVSVEAAELQELFLWADPAEQMEVLMKRRAEVEDEVADVLIQLLNFVAVAKIDLLAAAEEKVRKNAVRYPLARSRGKADKAQG
jgi:dCTP diphosphatase